jgi:hypothetical protein
MPKELIGHATQQLYSQLCQVVQLRNMHGPDVDALVTALDCLSISMAPSCAAAKDNTLMLCV